MALSQKARNLLGRWSTYRAPISMELQNFKAFGAEGSGVIPIKPITLVFGANSAGKSSLLHSLLWLDHGTSTGEWDVHHPRLAGDLVDLGGFSNFVHKHEKERVISVSREVYSRQNDVIKATVGFGRVKVSDHSDEEEEDQETQSQEEGSNNTSDHILELPEDTIGLKSYEISVGNHVVLRFIRKDSKMKMVLLDFPMELLRPTYNMLAMRNNLDGARTQRQLQRAARRKIPIMPYSKEELDELMTKLLDDGIFEIEGDRLLSRGSPVNAARTPRNRLRRQGDIPSAEEVVLQAVHDCTKSVSNSFSGSGMRESMGTVYIGPLRVYPDRNLNMLTESEHSDWMGSGLFAWELLRELPEVRERLNTVMSEFLGLGYEFQIANRTLSPEEALEIVDREMTNYFNATINEAEDQNPPDQFDALYQAFESAIHSTASNNDSGNLRLIDSRTGTALSAKDVGMGISQVIPILVAASALRRKTICMEQPELHLHPGLQTRLADALIASARQQNNTLIIETHSEHLILRILRRIRESSRQRQPDGLPRIGPNDISVIYMKEDEKGEGTIAQQLKVDAQGRFIDEWPEGFFEDRLEELI